MMEISEALQQLDQSNDEHWTQNGLPSIAAVATLMGRTPTRQEVTDAAPHFTRENPELSLEIELPSPLITELEVNLAQAQQKAEEARKELAEANEKMDRLLMEKEKNAKPNHVKQQEDIRYYLDRQIELRYKQAMDKKRVLASLSNEDLKALMPRSPLDAALMRRPRQS